jgi:hypothetical protein
MKDQKSREVIQDIKPLVGAVWANAMMVWTRNIRTIIDPTAARKSERA